MIVEQAEAERQRTDAIGHQVIGKRSRPHASYLIECHTILYIIHLAILSFFYF